MCQKFTTSVSIKALDDVHSQVLFMDQSCKGMSTKLSAVKTRTHQLMSQMTGFQSSRLAHYNIFLATWP